MFWWKFELSFIQPKTNTNCVISLYILTILIIFHLSKMKIVYNNLNLLIVFNKITRLQEKYLSLYLVVVWFSKQAWI